MRLRKKIVSAIMAACMAVTMLPVNVPLTAVEAKAAGEEIVTLAEDTTNVDEYSQYIPTGITDYDFYFDSSNLSNNEFDAVYLFDSENKMVASTDSYEPITPSNNNIKCHLYCTRELIAGEELHLGYEVNSIISVLNNTKITVTDQPYISSIESDWHFNTDDTYIVLVKAYNTDFNKLSFILTKNEKTIASSVSSTVVNKYEDEAYYCIELSDGETLEHLDKCTVEYTYSDGNEVQKYIGADSFLYDIYNNRNIRWNYKTNSVEYYNKAIQSGSKVSYEIYDSSKTFVTSGGAIQVNDNHLVTINLQDKLDTNKYNSYQLDVYDANTRIATSSFHVGQIAFSSSLNEYIYLSDDKELEFSAEIISDNGTELPETCIADIIADNRTNNGTKIEQVTMTLESENHRLSYNGIFKNSLPVGEYMLSFDIDGKHHNYLFYVCDSTIMSLAHQSNDISSGEVNIYFPSDRTANWYCGEENEKIEDKLRIKILNIRKKEINSIKGTYNSADGDFTIIGDSNYRTIRFNDKMKEELDNLYFCYVYISIIDENGKEVELRDAYIPLEEFYKKERHNNTAADRSIEPEKYMRSESNRWINLGCDGVWLEAYPDYSIVYGSDNAFPATVTVTDWYSLTPIATIDIPYSGYSFTESNAENLSSKNLYRFFLKGSDGSADYKEGYVKKSDETENNTPEDNKPEDNKPDNSENNNTSGGISGGGTSTNFGNGSSSASSGISGGGISVSYVDSTSEPIVTSEPVATPTPIPTIAPAPIVTPEPVATPEPTVTPEETTAPEPTAAPENNTPNITDNNEEEPSPAPGELNLKKKKITLKEGQKAKIRISSDVNTDVVYKSLNPSIATVNKNGVVTAKKNGKATITVQANGKIRKVKITVKAAKTAETDSSSGIKLSKNFKLSKTKVTLKRGNKLKIKRASGLSGKVTYRSINKKVASVSSKGVIKAKRKGKATIQIKRGKKTIKLKVTVKK